MVRIIRGLARRLTGPTGRRLVVLGLVAGLWVGWWRAAPRPLSEWSAASWEPADWRLTPDRAGFACTTYRNPGQPQAGPPPYGPVRLWDLATGRERLSVGADRGTPGPDAMRMAPDGSWLLVTRWREARADKVVLQLWDVATGRERWSTPAVRDEEDKLPPGYVVSPDGRYVACRRDDGTSDLLSLATGEVHAALGNAGPLAFAPDGRTLVTASPPAPADRPVTLTLWDTATARPGRRLTLELAGSLFARDLEALSQRQRWRVRDQVQRVAAAAAVSPDGRWLAVLLFAGRADPPQVVELWDLRAGARAAELGFGGVWDANCRGVEFSPDGALLFAPGPGAARAWDVRQTPPRAVEIAEAGLSSAGPSMNIQAGGPSFPVFSPDGTRFLANGPDRRQLTIRATAEPDRAVVAALRSAPQDRPDFAPDGRAFAVRCSAVEYLTAWQRGVNATFGLIGLAPAYVERYRSEVMVFDAGTGEVRGRVGGLPAETRLIGFAADGRSVWTFSCPTSEGPVRVQQWPADASWSWPPPWLLAATAAGLALVVLDWRRARRTSPVDRPPAQTQ